MGAEVVVVMKTSSEYGRLKDAPPCPSVKVNDTFIARKSLITFEQLKAALLNEEASCHEG